MAIDIAIKLREYAELTEKALDGYLTDENVPDKTLIEAMRYSTLGGGKRIRAFLVISFSGMFGGSVEKALPFACAVEMIHAYSLIHDDLPAMDDSPVRRGKPSCHIRYGEATALLAGDALLTYAFNILSDNKNVSDKSFRLSAAALSDLAAHRGMCGGQAIDLSDEISSENDLFELYYLKTGALIEAACLLGYYSACDDPNPDVVEDIKKYARLLGIAFQIHDDILDVTGDPEVIGKPVGNDEKADKKTILYFRDLKSAEKLEYDLTVSAVDAVTDYADSDGPCQLAIWLMSRKK
ncbi:MAG: polyprenyl synthetase family protein [Clostridia bacterium]|nr:polyprenyl synthetase family protein [Clostridia bacterium]MBR7032309.1 polyprenyl synthetase family protein [Clostridia bacterium]